MLTERDLTVGTHAAVAAMQNFGKVHPVLVPLIGSLGPVVAKAVIEAVDQARSPVSVGEDVLGNLLRPRE